MKMNYAFESLYPNTIIKYDIVPEIYNIEIKR